MERWTAALKGFAYLVLALLAVTAGYVAVTAVRYWPAINV
ncbi:hypothetical protein IP92_01196 [Pseudoduganella flava]|uniref:Uncharacterized protein n=1 Tax=Pseudoduganella flava TaxID=871742 RepID=A0A562PZV1_9BURK|nr:hypothetical protein IP92_01196 [Pseudoduganella flava]